MTRDDAEGTDPLRVALTRRRLWWIGGAIGSISLGAVVAAALISAPGAPAAPGARSTPGSVEERVPGSSWAVSDVAASSPEAAAAAGRPASGKPVARIPRDAPVHGAPAEHASRLAEVAAATPEAPPPSVRRPARRLAGKRLVVDYSARPSDPPPPGLVAQDEEDPAIARARTAYTTGNQKLFAGDLDGAIRAYHEALELYPGYVGGYRGLGLAYAQRGDTASALAALKEYVAAVPTARDIALIKKRIAHLQGK